MRTLSIAVVLIVAPLITAPALGAQEAPAFHAGQWAAEFSGGAANSAGVMRFINPRSALVLSFNGSISRTTATPDGDYKTVNTVRNLNLALGMRRHASIASRVLATTELGLDLGYNRQKTGLADAFGNPITSRSSQTSFGIYGEIGGQYFVAPHLALGAVATLNASMSRGRNETQGTGTDYSGLSLNTFLRPIRITLYF